MKKFHPGGASGILLKSNAPSIVVGMGICVDLGFFLFGSTVLALYPLTLENICALAWM